MTNARTQEIKNNYIYYNTCYSFIDEDCYMYVCACTFMCSHDDTTYLIFPNYIMYY